MNNLADTRRGNLPIRSLHVDRNQTFSLRIKCPNQGLQILRYLLTKFYARKEKLNPREEAVFWLLIDYFENLRNDEFFIDNLVWLKAKKLTEIYIERNFEEKHIKASIKLLILGLAYTPRAFLGLKYSKNLDEFLRQKNRKLAKDHAPQRRIGVDYRDKGAAKVAHYDASPSWQEVAQKTSWEHPLLGRIQKEPERFLQIFRTQLT